MYTNDSTHDVPLLTVKQVNTLLELLHPTGSELRPESTAKLLAGWPSSVLKVRLTLLEFPTKVATGFWLGVPTTLLSVVAR